MEFLRIPLRLWGLTFLGTVLLLLSYPPFRWSPLIWFAWAPLLVVVYGLDRPWKGLILWGTAGVIFFTVHLSWILHLQVEPWVEKFLVLGWVLLVLYEAAYWGVLGWGAVHLVQRGRELWIPVLWLLLEWLRGQGATGFPWAPVALPVVEIPWLKEWFAVVGMYGVGLWVMLFSVLVVHPSPKTRSGAIALLVLLFLGGGLHVGSRGVQPAGTLRVAILQPNVLPAASYWEDWKITKEGYDPLLDSLASQRVSLDLLILSESAFPGFYRYSRIQQDYIRKVFQKVRVRAILFGSGDTRAWNQEQRPTNTAFLIQGDRVLGTYDKVHLVPFGEWIPWENRISWLQRINFGEGDYLPGDTLRPLEWEGVKIGVLICFESMFPELARGLVREGAQFLANLTNDGWFGKSLGPLEHFEFARMRALETGREVVRAAKTGTSAIIDREGKVRQRLPFGTQGLLIGTVRLYEGATLYVKYGNFGVFLIGLMIIGLGLFQERRRS